MKGIKNIVFKKNNISFIMNINNNKLLYQNILKIIDDETIFKYLESLFGIINSWKNEYIDTRTIDGDYWKLSIDYEDGSKKEYYGKSQFSNNFEAFGRLNQK